MVKTKGPCLSTKASGQLGRTLIYSSSKGRSYLKYYKRPAQPKTNAQLAMRAMTSFLSRSWQFIPTAVQATWSIVDPAKDIPLYNRYLSFNLKRHRDNLPPTGDPNILDQDFTRSWTALVMAKVSRGTHTTVTCTAENGLWGLMFYRQLDSYPTARWDRLVHVHIQLTTGLIDWTDRPLAPGHYYYNIYPFGIYGKRATSPWERHIEVT